jgi:PAS domain S-box-containing protein
MSSSGAETRSDAGGAAKLRALLESAVDAIVTIDRSGAIDSANRATERLFQYREDELLEQNVRLLMPEPYRAEHDDYLRRYLDTGERRIIGIGREVTGRRKDGSTFPMHLSVSEFEAEGETYFTGIIHDLSEMKSAQNALHHAQKMEAIGELTGGVAHDFNNLLTVITGNLELLDMKLADNPHRDLLNEAQEAAELGARLTERLLAFARRSHLAPEVVDLNALVIGLTDMLHRTIGETIDLSTVLSTGLWTAKVDPTQVESAILNLAVNARDAMPDGGKLIVETRNAEIDELYAASEQGLAAGNYVQLSVSDTGTGMSEQVRQRVFEPFFTTKGSGRGTGLGLSMVYGFAKQSGGHATIYSEVGKGTTINLYLPQHREAGAPATADKDEAIPVSAGSELILVVEDDSRVRRLTALRLTELGYKVKEAASGPEALEILGRDSSIDLVFSDLVMPGGMSGYELCMEIRKRMPGIRLLLTSGYADELMQDNALEENNLALLRKPYMQAGLGRAIRKALGGE